MDTIARLWWPASQTPPSFKLAENRCLCHSTSALPAPPPLLFLPLTSLLLPIPSVRDLPRLLVGAGVENNFYPVDWLRHPTIATGIAFNAATDSDNKSAISIATAPALIHAVVFVVPAVAFRSSAVATVSASYRGRQRRRLAGSSAICLPGRCWSLPSFCGRLGHACRA
ncbi:unnamed protein product [Ectocarpus sp. 13 AM-2016]